MNSSSDENGPTNPESRAFFVLFIVVGFALGWILLPFYGAIMWGSIIALIFSPLHRLLMTHLNCQHTLAALLTLMIVVVIVILPFALVTASLAHEAGLIYEQLVSGELKPERYFRGLFDALPDWITALLDRFGLVNFSVLQRRLSVVLTQASQFFTTQALSIGQITFDFVVQLLITLYLAFFLIRDGDDVMDAVRCALPLSVMHKRVLLETFATVVRATIKGNLVVAVIQGTLGGLAFWFLGVSGALLWAVLMAFLSLVPAVGSALVWLPVAIYFLVVGALWQGIALTVYGVLVIGLVDNVLRPLLVGRDTRLPDYVVMITTVGGMAVLGINGFILGPMIAALFIAVWRIYAMTRSGDVPPIESDLSQ